MPNLRIHYPRARHPELRLGRNVNHDPRSRRFPVRAQAEIRSVMHDRKVPVFDQGELGSCTGNAGIGCMGTLPFYDTVKSRVEWTFDEDGAIGLYSAATKLDDFTGTYPPADTGSDGLSIAKALTAAGWIAGYEHAFSLDEFLAGLMTRPCIVGTEWHEGMGYPDKLGVVHPNGPVQGGHEYEAIGYDATSRMVWFVNSWGRSWGRGGFFAMPRDEFARLLARQGDATFFTPLTAPAPQPSTPVRTADEDLAAALRAWGASDALANHAEREAFRRWLAAKGL